MGVAGRDRFHRIERALHKPRVHQDEVDLTVLAMRRPPREQCEQDPPRATVDRNGRGGSPPGLTLTGVITDETSVILIRAVSGFGDVSAVNNLTKGPMRPFAGDVRRPVG
jgi:hypothetical protein